MIEYDPHKWTEHLFDIKGSVARDIIGRVLMVTGWATAVTLFHIYVRPVAVPTTVHTLVGVAMGLLLVIRTNASYDRFWEGRKMWGGIVNESRNLTRAASAFLPGKDATFERIVLWTIAFAYSSMNVLRGTNGLGETAERRLPPGEIKEVLAARHVPSAVALRISSLIAEERDRGHVSDFVALAIDNNVQQLIDYLGSCERIRKTPLPFAYVVHLRRALLIYCATLPFALVETYGWYTVMDTLIITYILFGIDEIGVEIEDPFGDDDNDLPLEDICGTIENNLLGHLDGPGEPSPLAKAAHV